MLVAMIAAAVLAQAPAESATTGAATAPVAAKATEAAPEKPKDKKICVVEQQMGSHFKKKICATADEWDRRREKDAKNMSRVTGEQ